MKKFYIYITASLLSLSACSDWLDVASSDQIKESNLFDKGSGFRSSLLGVYQELAMEDLYGKNMTWGFVDALGQLYDPSALTGGSDLTIAPTYNYAHSYVKPVIDNIWESMYKAIANCNNLIANIENASPSIFEYKEEEKSMIQGEALALRAFMHFDLLRLFAPSVAAKGDGAYIPYCDTYPSIYSKKLSTPDVLKRVIEDLEKAQDLTAQFDTLPDNIGALQRIRCRVENENFFAERGIFYGYRCTRMNYLNITALLARVYLYAGDVDKAYESAKYVLAFKGIDYPSKYGGYKGNSKSRDDILLCFFSKKATEFFRPFTGEDGYLKLKNIQDLYSGENTDRRYSEMTNEIVTDVRISSKYKEYSDDSYERINGPLIPVLRKGEMYHIACEYFIQHKQLGEAIILLDELRRLRGLGYDNLDTDMTEPDFINKLHLDAHKEFVGEGQVFFLYKRLNLPIWDGSTNGPITPIFVLPTPDSENV